MSSVASQLVIANAEQRAAATIIERGFTAAGYSPLLIAAAIVNAYAESRLDPKVSGDKGISIGLFQLNTKHGAGIGYSISDLQDPTFNTQILLKVERKALLRVQAAIDAGASLSEAAGLFSQYVERPEDTLGERAKRAASALILFPFGLSNASGPGIQSVNANRLKTSSTARTDTPSVATSKSSVSSYVWAGSSLLALFGAWHYFRTKKENEMDSGAFQRYFERDSTLS